MAKLSPEAAARAFALDLANAMSERLHAIVLYGSAARGEFADNWSDINILVFADHIDEVLLAAVAPVMHVHEDSRVAPLLLTWGERPRAADAFAIELLDMQDAHVLLWGDEPFAGTIVEPAALRLQAERELRSRLATLDSRLLRVAKDDRAIGQLLAVALPSFVTYMRAALRLAGESVPGTMAEVITQGARLVGASEGGFRAALEARTAGGGWRVALADPAVSQYRTAVQCTAHWVDSIEKELR
jgi:hypothetical protein